MKTLLKNGRLSNGQSMDVFIQDDFIQVLGQDLDITCNEVIDLQGQTVLPGLVDVHVHLREPGFEHKETIETGSKAAARGGFTQICAMPNLDPVPSRVETLVKEESIIKQTACVDVHPYATITTGLREKTLVDMKALKESGAFAFTNDGVGVQSSRVMYEAMKQAAQLNMPIVAHTEDEDLLYGGVMNEGKKSQELGLPGILNAVESAQIARDLVLAEETGVHYHVCHVSSKESVRLIRDAKQAGVNVTCEVTPHHLILCEDDILADDGKYKMNPPLRTKEDQQALIEGLLDGTIDCIATDHAPHTTEEKQGSMKEAAFGIVGSEIAFPLMYTFFVKSGKVSLDQLVQWMSANPATIFNLPKAQLHVGDRADLTVVDLNKEMIIDSNDFVSKGKVTPFEGMSVTGIPTMTFVKGQCIYKEEE